MKSDGTDWNSRSSLCGLNQTKLLSVNQYEQSRIQHIEAIYENFEKRSALEITVSLTVISPLLDAAGLFHQIFLKG